MKKWKRWITGKAKYRFINGGKGVISIFLALLMIPFIVQADLLIELSRYHAAVSALDQIMDSAAMSALSNYDSYIMKRFGLAVIGQQSDPTAVYQSYFNSNLEGSRIAWRTNSISVQGQYSLNDNQVLENAILEMAKYSVPTEMASSFVMSAIEHLFGDSSIVKSLDSIASAVTSVSTAVGSLADVVTVFENLKDETQRAENLKVTYDEKFNQFKTKTGELVEALKEVERKQQAKQIAEQELSAANAEGADISNQIQSVNQQISGLDQQLENDAITQEAYDAAVAPLKTQLSELQGRQNASNTRISNANNAVNTANNELTAAQNQAATKRSETQTAAQEYAAAVRDLRDSLTLCKQYSVEVISKVGTAAENCLSAAEDVKNMQIDREKSQQSTQRQEQLKEEIKSLEEQLSNGVDDLSTAQELQNQLDWNKYLLENYENDTTYSDMKADAGNMFTLAGQGTKNATDVVKDAMSSFQEGTVTNCINTLNTIYNRVSSFSASSVTTSFVFQDSVYYVTISGLAPVARIQGALTTLDENFSDSDSDSDSDGIGFWTLIKGISNLMDGLFKINLFYDASLDAFIQGSLVPNESGGIDNLIFALVAVAKDLKEFNSTLSLIKKLKALVSLILDIANAIKCLAEYLITLTTDLFSGLAQLFTGAYDKALLAEYLNQSCANRTTYTKSNLLTGYKFSAAGMGTAENKVDSIFLVGAFTALATTIGNYASGDGSSSMFVGAETEYLLVGSRSELVNQVAVFFNLYLIRLIVNFLHIVVFGDKEVQLIKAAADAGSLGIGGTVVVLLYVLLEPFIDTVVLVNGAKIDLMKSFCYLTPTGIPTLIGRLTSLKLKDSEKDEIMARYAAALHVNYYSGTKASKDSDSFIKFNYSDYMFMFLLIQNKEKQLNRFRNVIMLESKKQNSSFDIGKTYTYLSAEVKGEYVPFLSAASIYTNLAFSGTRNQVRGY